MPKESENRVLAVIVAEDMPIDLSIYHDFEKVWILDKLDYFYLGSMLKFIAKFKQNVSEFDTLNATLWPAATPKQFLEVLISVHPLKCWNFPYCLQYTFSKFVK